MTLQRGAFRALLLLILPLSAVSVLPPTNVNVSCSDYRVTVSWEYGTQEPTTVFRVAITGGEGKSTYNTTERHYDLTSFIWASEDRYMDNFFVSVSATLGRNRSTRVESKTFTFNRLKSADMKCELEFPPVELSGKKSRATVTFKNPFFYSRELRSSSKPDAGRFGLTLTTRPGDEHEFFCGLTEENCKCNYPIPGGEECVRLSGMLLGRDEVRQVMFRQTDFICITNSPDIQLLLILILLPLSAIIITLVVIIVLLMKTPGSLPLTVQPYNRRKEQRYANVSREAPSVVHLVDPSYQKAPCSSEKSDEKVGGTGSASSEGHWRDESTDDSVKEFVCVNLVEEGSNDGADEDLIFVYCLRPKVVKESPDL